MDIYIAETYYDCGIKKLKYYAFSYLNFKFRGKIEKFFKLIKL